MVVRTKSNGREITGLYIGARNVRRHFKKDLKGIELQMGHLHIRCELGPEFWHGQPEIRDPRLGDWLKARFHSGTGRAPVPIALIPAEKNSFKLQPMRLPPVSAQGLAKLPAIPSAHHKPAPKVH